MSISSKTNALRFAIKGAANDLNKKVSRRTNLLLSKPMQVSICPTQRCNARCLMCDCWREKNDYITKDDILRFLADLRDWTGGDFFVQIAGGEPLVFNGIFEIFKYCSENKIVCKISSNGLALNESVCQKIIGSGLPYLSVSLDSHLPEVHDKYRGLAGTFDKAVQGLKYLRANSDMTLGVSCIVMKENVGHLKEMTEFFLGMDIDRILFQPIRDYNNPLDKWPEYPFWVNDHEALDDAMDSLIEIKGKDKRLLNSVEDFELIREYFKDPQSIVNKRDCFIGYESLFVDDKGNITLCESYQPIGNIRNRDVKDLWHAQHTRNERDSMVKCALPCTSNCKKEMGLTQKVSKFFHLYQAGLFR